MRWKDTKELRSKQIQVILSITEKQLDILKELVCDEIDNDSPNTRDECNDLYSKLCCVAKAAKRFEKKKEDKNVR